MKKQDKPDPQAEVEVERSEEDNIDNRDAAQRDGEQAAATNPGKAEDQLRRAMADLANMRKRQAKDREEARQRAIEGISAELLPVLDNFYLALFAHEQSTSSEASAEVQNMLDGLVMVRGLLEGTLERHGVAAIPTDGAMFDPNRHEAVGVDSDSDADDGTIVRVVQRGYMLGDKVLRASRVVVAGAPQGDATTAGGDESTKPN